MHYLALILSVLIQGGSEQSVSQSDLAKITIVNNGGPPSSYETQRFDAGPSLGSILEAHFFPGLDHYNAGRYAYAQIEMAYVVARPTYLDENPRGKEFLSTSHYLLGMIYIYHANGLGRRNVAREHFEKAIQLNPRNYLAYVELARVFAELRITKHASEIIQRLLELNPPEAIAAQARDELNKLSSNDQ
jgi:tetratricopeptide (TPR) repeat protein